MAETEEMSARPDGQRKQRRRSGKRRRARMRRIRLAVLALALIVIAAAVFLIVHFSEKDILRGTWTDSGTTTYVFDGRGSGTLRLPQGDYAFDYAINEQELKIDFEDPSAADAGYTFEVKGGSLILINAAGREYRFDRQN